MAAEGGTGYAHGVTLARSPVDRGAVRTRPAQPVPHQQPRRHPRSATTRTTSSPQWFNPDAELQKAGHGCLVSTPHGEWYVAHLCARPIGPDHRCTLGRETALQQVRWSDDGWLRLSTGGTLARLETPSPTGVTPDAVASDTLRRTEFRGPEPRPLVLDLPEAGHRGWLEVGRDGPGLRLRGGEAVTSRHESSVVATPLQGFVASVETGVDVAPQHFSQSAGLLVIYDDRNLLYARVYAEREPGCPGRRPRHGAGRV